ncbi:O-antigen ligase family protein [Gallaecimonas sp. GXIMD1310]|uniref:O-antigen ligase family protein n=1 Tax=Gallaecimonas sp. GXIMD1310 TaxID=3131926 RepID=UPI00325405E1
MESLKLNLKIKNLNYHYLVLLVVFLFPAFKWTQGGTALGQKLMHLCVLFIYVPFFLMAAFNKNSFINSTFGDKNRKHIIQSLFYFFSVSIYFVAVVFFISPNPSVSDFSDFFRPFVYFLYFSIPLIFPIRQNEINKLFAFLLWSVLIQILFSAFVYIKALWPIVDVFKGRMSDDIIQYHFFRWSGTFVYPSDFSFFLSFFFYYLIYSLGQSFSVGKKIKFTILIIFIFTAIFMTLSRGGLASVLFISLLIYIFTSLKKSLFFNATIIIVFVSLFGAVVWALSSSSFEKYNFDYIVAPFSKKGPDDSTKHRIIELELAEKYSTKHFPFGVGGDRENLSKEVGVIESYYGNILIRWGWFGLFINFIFLFYILLIAFKLIKFERSVENKSFFVAAFFTIASVPIIFGFSSAMSDRFKTLPFYYLLCGYVVSYYCGILTDDRKFKNE